MSLAPDLLAILVCPKCKGPLEHRTNPEALACSGIAASRARGNVCTPPASGWLDRHQPCGGINGRVEHRAGLIDGGALDTHIVREGTIDLTPPGMSVPVSDLLGPSSAGDASSNERG